MASQGAEALKTFFAIGRQRSLPGRICHWMN